MSRTFVFDRFDVRGCACDDCQTGVTTHAEFDGEWVKAQDAISREAVLQAQIRTLETQLKDARAANERPKATLSEVHVILTDAGIPHLAVRMDRALKKIDEART
ncbi:hypothetical protein AWB80_08170 [Caballeronia pedi]|uniref:Uncharacterized protein n=1 Tax=Caballeronia pedi TaxID=1777141 RepID=A0A158E4H6_9BURK|nr:hypothetical protein [Caballeronia pedi]SAL01630.1 hypothetical protein AWB80_08170 [Caballeronia pedi]